MNNTYSKTFKIIGISLALCSFLFWVFLRTERILRFKSNIPEKLELGRVVLQGENSTPWIFAFVIPGESCGGGIFKLSKSNLKSIKLRELSFFEDATKPRGRKYKYPAWKETPVPHIWTSDGAWTGLVCVSQSNRNKLIRKIIEASELPNSYYTYLGNYRVVVFPDLGFVSFTYAN